MLRLISAETILDALSVFACVSCPHLDAERVDKHQNQFQALLWFQIPRQFFASFDVLISKKQRRCLKIPCVRVHVHTHAQICLCLHVYYTCVSIICSHISVYFSFFMSQWTPRCCKLPYWKNNLVFIQDSYLDENDRFLLRILLVKKGKRKIFHFVQISSQKTEASQDRICRDCPCFLLQNLHFQVLF